MADEEPKLEQVVPEQELLAELQEVFGAAVLEVSEFRDQPCALVDVGSLLAVCNWLKAERGFRYLADVIGVDYPKREKRFEVVYQLYCHERAERLRLKVRVAEGEPVPSLTSVWSGAGWPERECFDLMGISFAGHPDLRRSLLPPEATGHPLRKDYPLRGRDDLGYRVARGAEE
jgi:NADH-quinone oxidoreductase subunit C